MNFSITILAPTGNVDSVLTYFFETRRRCCQKELPEGIYNYGTNGTGIQIIIELNSGLFEIVHNLNIDKYAYQYHDV